MTAQTDHAAALYLDLLKQCLTRSIFPDGACPVARRAPMDALAMLSDPDNQEALASGKMEVIVRQRHDPALREEGHDWPAEAETMIGQKRIDNLQRCVTDVLERGVPGDLLEAGVWRGGATIFMRALLKVYGDTTRRVWVLDSFAGLPPPDLARYPKEHVLDLSRFSELAVPLEEVQQNFRKYGMLDDQVRFVKGFFRDTLPGLPVERLALLRLDGDLYESTMLTLMHLYPRLSSGGYVIVDDYHIPACRAACEEFRGSSAVKSEIHTVDWTGAYWQKS